MRSLVVACALLLGWPAPGWGGPPASSKGKGAGRAKGRAAKRARPIPRAARCRDIFCTSQVLRLDGSGRETRALTDEQVDQVVGSHRQRLEPCLVQARRRDPTLLQARLEFVVNAQGRVLASRVDGRQGTPLARCVHKEMKSLRFPSSSLQRTVASVTLTAPQ